MPSGRLTFHRLVQDSQDFGSDNEHMVSRAFFSFALGEKRFDNLHVNIKQTVGSDFESAPLEVSPPIGYSGPFNYESFRTHVEAYYRSLVGGSGRGIRTGGARNLRMRDNAFGKVYAVDLDVPDAEGSW